jgi:hypothetical protein
MDSAVQDERAPALFQAAADKFQEVSAHGARPPARERAAPASHPAAVKLLRVAASARAWQPGRRGALCSRAWRSIASNPTLCLGVFVRRRLP